MTLYCNCSSDKTLHVGDLRTTGLANHEAHNAADLHRIIGESGATHVSFDFGNMPRKAVAVGDAKLAALVTKLFRQLAKAAA